MKACSRSRLFPPRNVENKKKAPEQIEENRGRIEQRDLECEVTTPSTLCFPGAAQVGRLTRRVKQKDGKNSIQTVYVISSLSPKERPAKDFLKLNRDYWRIESDLHYRLDEVLDEDRSRVRSPKSAHILGMFRRLCVSLAIHWLRTVKRKRATTRDFLDHMRAKRATNAWLLLTSIRSKTWLS